MQVDEEDLKKLMYAMDAVDSYICEHMKGTELETVFGFIYGELLPKLDQDQIIPEPTKKYTIHDVMNEF